jgi:protein-tyrosine kinase
MATVIRKDEIPKRARQTRSSPIADWLKSTGRLSAEDVNAITSLQQKRGIWFGEAAIELGLLTVEELNRVLSQQLNSDYLEVGIETLDPALHIAHDPAGAYSEAIRTLRNQLSLRWFSQGHKTLAIVEGRCGEGCSGVAANLAIAFSQTGARTLLVDTNLRKPTQCRLFGIQAPEGLAGVLDGGNSLIHAITEIPAVERLAVLRAGASVPNPQELLSQPTFASLLQNLSSSFDVVLVDCAPLLESADAQLIAARCRGCLIVARQDKTRVEDIQKSKHRLEPSGATLLGVTLIGR